MPRAEIFLWMLLTGIALAWLAAETIERLADVHRARSMRTRAVPESDPRDWQGAFERDMEQARRS